MQRVTDLGRCAAQSVPLRNATGGSRKADAGARLIPGRRLALWLRSEAARPAVRGTVHEEAAEAPAEVMQGGAALPGGHYRSTMRCRRREELW
jgi:hypothetical protein